MFLDILSSRPQDSIPNKLISRFSGLNTGFKPARFVEYNLS